MTETTPPAETRIFCSVCDTEIQVDEDGIFEVEWCPKCKSDSSQWIERETPPPQPQLPKGQETLT